MGLFICSLIGQGPQKWTYLLTFGRLEIKFKFNILFQILHFIYYKMIQFIVLLQRMYKKYFDVRIFYGIGKDDISSEYFAELYLSRFNRQSVIIPNRL
jgi:hypothetical protein